MNKALLLPIIFLIIPAGLFSQESQKILINNNKVAAEQFGPEFQQIYPDFRNSRVVYKGLSPINCRANYNFLLDEIHYLNEKGDTMAIANPRELSYVIIGDRMFIPSEKGFLEV
jgi:hypothetical protein